MESFREFIAPGNKVVIKPNWVREKNPINPDITGLVTHPSVVRTVIDYCLIALQGKGRIIIGDAPIQSADIDIIKSKLQLDELVGFYSNIKGVKIEIRDFRKEIKRYNSAGEISEHILLLKKNLLKLT